MLSLIYSSVATRPLGDDDLAHLLEQSRRANAENDITGVLLFRNGYFLQLLEGPDRAVRTKMETIKHDDRHTKVTVLLEDVVEERQFPEWTMGYPAEDTDVEQAPGYRTTFDDLDGGAQVASLPALRELIRWFRPRGD
ncbi:BLUF domain-containing protein [Curtobacterium sp. MCBA15_004]|uniref:BLUF domain-containing protein n=1 Tax=unclassified Curtobacterium TaxID=257496 RepID=UPI0008DDAFE1|nr:BLUF domain-containing protein [Curtobacterium sp. MCBA15_004]WIA97097.1 BLUF domain-containing protein [Curtobacterium sp. MCBA15_004]